MAVVVVITLVLMAISRYVQRGVQGRVADLSDAMIIAKDGHLLYTDVDEAGEFTSSATNQSGSMVTQTSEGGATQITSDISASYDYQSVTYDEDDTTDPGTTGTSGAGTNVNPVSGTASGGGE